MYIRVDIIAPRPIIYIEHGKEEPLWFSASVFQKDSFRKDEYDVFGEINRYWASLPNYKQEEIFSVYKDVFRGFSDIYDGEELTNHIEQSITRLYHLHPFKDLVRFLKQDPYVHIPEGIVDDYDPTHDGHTRSKTYTSEDYYGLASYSLFLRTIMAILGEFVESTRREVGVEYKEYAAMQLLLPSKVLEEPAVKKLITYIEHIGKDNSKDPERILSGFSSEDSLFLNLALTTVRRLCVTDLRGNVTTRHLVSIVYNFVYQRTTTPAKSRQPFKSKPVQNSGREDSNRSTMEAYRKRTELSYAELAGIEYGYEDYMGTALRLAPEITEREVKAGIRDAQPLIQAEIADPQIMLLDWLFKTVHANNTSGYIPKPLLVDNLGVAQAVLWHWGHKYLACYITSNIISDVDTMHITSMDSKGQIPKEIQDEIIKHYPFVWLTVKRNRETEQDLHPVLHNINLITDEITSHSWKMNISDAKRIEVFDNDRVKFPLLPDIKTEIAKLIIDIEDRRP